MRLTRIGAGAFGALLLCGHGVSAGRRTAGSWRRSAPFFFLFIFIFSAASRFLTGLSLHISSASSLVLVCGLRRQTSNDVWITWFHSWRIYATPHLKRHATTAWYNNRRRGKCDKTAVRISKLRGLIRQRSADWMDKTNQNKPCCSSQELRKM